MTEQRAELERLADEYLNALASRDPARLSLHSAFRLTENGQALEIGDGIWGTANGRGRYRHIVADVESGSVAVTSVLKENGLPVIAGIRL